MYKLQATTCYFCRCLPSCLNTKIDVTTSNRYYVIECKCAFMRWTIKSTQ